MSWGAAATTITQRMLVVRALAECVDVQTMTASQIEGWLAQPRFAAWTRVTYFGHVRSLCEWMRKTGLRLDDPTADMKPPKPPKGKPRPLSPAEAALVLATATGQLHTWMLLGMFAGLRAHEMAKIRGEHVTADSLYVVGKGNKAAMIPTHPLIWQAAQDYPRAGYWFPSRGQLGHVNPKSISAATTRLFCSLGIEGSTHRARHTYGTNLLRGGANLRVVQELMRHDSLTSTQVYTQVADDEKSAAIRLLGPAA